MMAGVRGMIGEFFHIPNTFRNEGLVLIGVINKDKNSSMSMDGQGH